MPIKKNSRDIEDEDEDEEILIQGDDYEEQGNGDDDDIDVHEDRTALSTKKIAIIVAGALVVIGVIFLIVVTTMSKGKATTATTTNAANKFDDATAVPTDATAEKMANNATAGTTATANNGTAANRVDQVLEQAGVVDTVDGYSETDCDSLRAAGYTGPQIEKYEKEAKTVEELLVKAKVEKDRFLQERYKELDTQARTNESSDAFKSLRDSTWLSGDPKVIVADQKETYTTETITYNASFEKVPLRGNQCLIKLYLDKDKGFAPAFMNMHPDKFAKLKDSGNIVVSFDVVTYNNAKYVNNIQEVNIS